MLIARLQRTIAWTIGSLLLIAFNSSAWLVTMPLRRRSKWVAWAVLTVVLFLAWVVPIGDRRADTVAAAASLEHSYGLVSWELDNFFAKWSHRIWTALPWTPTGEADRRAALDRYVELVDELRLARGNLNTASSASDTDSDGVREAQNLVERLIAERDSLRDGVEEYLEQAISDTLRSDEVGLAGRFVWPPVDFRIDSPPKLLITSPRDEIRRIEDVLIDPETPSENIAKIEDQLFSTNNLSAIIVQTGGLASYPNVVPTTDLKRLLDVASHEWLHAHLTFYPLGLSYFRDAETRSINETLADMFGREVGLMVHSKLTGEPFVPPTRPETALRSPLADEGSVKPEESDEFDFNRFMAETRGATDGLLADGLIEEAESYMEERRVELFDHGYAIRKINQAYFAFHGTYAESPSSVSPIGRYLWDLREQVATVGDLVKLMRPVGSYQEFEELLVNRGIELEPGD